MLSTRRGTETRPSLASPVRSPARRRGCYAARWTRSSAGEDAGGDTVITAALLAALSLVCVAAATALAPARWPRRGPSSGIVLWQAIGLAWGLAMVGAALAVAVAPYGRGLAFGLVALVRGDVPVALGPLRIVALAGGTALFGLLVSALLASLVQVGLARRRHRTLLALLADGHPGLPGTLVVDHPAAAAYCVPGVRARVVVSAGALRLLARDELQAVLAHERAHARERHDLVLLPFTSLRWIFPRSRIVRNAIDAVSLLVEMRADDRALSEQPRRLLATALLRFGASEPRATPSGTLGIAFPAVSQDPVVVRALRLIGPSPALPRHIQVITWGTAGALAALPLALALLPL
ncbi:MAG: M48 family metalloprotease [Streptosporangiales bacterium]|nr:M48 family metalloprotease [Streptosporangiales bacterium]